MTTARHLPTVLLVFALMGAACAASAQTPPPPPPAVGNPAPPKLPDGPRLLTPEEKRDNAAPPNEQQPEGEVQPQISIPLGPQGAPLPTAPRAVAPGRSASVPAGVDDGVARCKAVADPQARARCRAGQPREPLPR